MKVSSFILHADRRPFVVRNIWDIVLLHISFCGEIRWSHLVMILAVCKKGRGACEKREKTVAEGL